MITKLTDKTRPTTMVPITTMEELPMLDKHERDELIASLEEADAHITAGEYAEYEPTTFKARLLNLYRKAKHHSHV